ncbi:beta-eliminating lyase-related protein [Kitasatospora paracochleata]|uniref:Threonine aldolase n=1 Tax=Kitasatospora paracochleata TaxID=58354 RepID=A0ABT1IWS7_9ACTN|nr:beta-eliminating lyase-related protein [Kitasatospora paracochleata]MCP2309605.1 threonine aldolase [Kitasatospora paracochleata]
MDDSTEATLKERRFAARRRAERLLSGPRPQTVRERLADLATLADAPYDLDIPTDIYGDGLVRTLEQRVAALLGKPDAAYFPTGTMAQQAALQVWAAHRSDGRYSDSRTVAMHPLAHPEVHERQAHARLSGLRTVWPTTAPRLPTAAELRSFDEPFHTLMLELPLREAGFVLPGWGELSEVYDVAEERSWRVHLDGARLWESAHHFGRSLPEICERADSVYVSCYKTIGAHSGALVAGDEEFVREAKVWRHRYGGKLFQQWPAVLTALAGLDRELPRLDDCITHAKTVADALAEAPGARVNPDPPHTHQFQLWLPHPAEALDRAGVALAERDGIALFGAWRDAGPLPGLAMTEVTVAADALDWTPKEITDAMAAFLELI